MMLSTEYAAVLRVKLRALRKSPSVMSIVKAKSMGLATCPIPLRMQVAYARVLEQDFARHLNFIVTVQRGVDVVSIPNWFGHLIP